MWHPCSCSALDEGAGRSQGQYQGLERQDKRCCCDPLHRASQLLSPAIQRVGMGWQFWRRDLEHLFVLSDSHPLQTQA